MSGTRAQSPRETSPQSASCGRTLSDALGGGEGSGCAPASPSFGRVMAVSRQQRRLSAHMPRDSCTDKGSPRTAELTRRAEFIASPRSNQRLRSSSGSMRLLSAPCHADRPGPRYQAGHPPIPSVLRCPARLRRPPAIRLGRSWCMDVALALSMRGSFLTAVVFSLLIEEEVVPSQVTRSLASQPLRTLRLRRLPSFPSVHVFFFFFFVFIQHSRALRERG